jgi:phosphinothricin acetyltransferase
MTKDDWDRVAAIYQQGIDSNGATFVGVCPSYEAWDAAHIKSCRYVAIIDHKVVGWIVLSPTSVRDIFSGVVEVSVYIDDTYQNCGVGSALMERMNEASEKEGFWCLYSAIFVENEASCHLHEKFGYRYIGYREKYAKDRFGNWRDTALYERRSKVII